MVRRLVLMGIAAGAVTIAVVLATPTEDGVAAAPDFRLNPPWPEGDAELSPPWPDAEPELLPLASLLR